MKTLRLVSVSEPITGKFDTGVKSLYPCKQNWYEDTTTGEFANEVKSPYICQ